MDTPTSQVRRQLQELRPVTFAKVGRLVRAGGKRLGKFRLHRRPTPQANFIFMFYFSYLSCCLKLA